jgi:uncharacterized protein
MAFVDPKTPGVYIQEVSVFPPSITSVATAIPAFLGYTANAVTEPKRITSMHEYASIFGGAHVYLVSDGSATAPAPIVNEPNYVLYYCMQMYFANGGGPCYVISTGSYPILPTAPAKADFTAALALLALEDEPTLIVMPDARVLTTAHQYDLYVAALAQCNKLQDRFTIIDVPSGETIEDFRDGIGTQNLKYGAVYYPDLVTNLSYPLDAIVFKGTLPNAIKDKTLAVAVEDSTEEWLAVEKDVRKSLTALSISLPPSAAVAGVYAAVDRDRGVWKAPANVSLTGVLKPSLTITNDEQQDLNVHSTGKSVNAIRAFTGKGILVWGARTLAGNDNEWRYVPVRRLFIMVEESVRKASEFVVFEPNDANTWLRVKTMIENFLFNLWKDGALAGAVPKDAFFVKCGINQTMTAQDILEGKLIIEIGMAAVRPAEFILLKFMHKLQES